MDNRFSAAIHALILICESPHPLTSAEIAESVGTNASYIRKLTTLLKNQGIIESHRGIGGFALLRKAEDLTLLQIYQAVQETDVPRIFDLHQNPNDQCIVGRHIRPILTDIFSEIEASFSRALAEKTLADCIAMMRTRIASTGDADFANNKEDIL